MPVEAFTVAVVDTGDDVLVAVTGALDLATCPQLADAFDSIDTDTSSDVVVDLSRVDFADSTAVDLLARVSLELAAHSRRLIMSNPSRIVSRLLSLTDVDASTPRDLDNR